MGSKVTKIEITQQQNYLNLVLVIEPHNQLWYLLKIVLSKPLVEPLPFDVIGGILEREIKWH